MPRHRTPKRVPKHKQTVKTVGGPEQAEDLPFEQSQRLMQKLEVELERFQVRAILSGAVLFILVFFFIHIYIRRRRISSPPPPDYSQELIFTPNYALSLDEIWVIPYAPQALKSLTQEVDNPLSRKWVRNTAYHIIVGERSFAHGEFRKAAAHFKRALEINPDICRIHEFLGAVYLHLEKLSAAEKHLTIAMNREGPTPSVLNNIGVIMMKRNHLDEAESFFLKAIEKAPDNPECHKNLALLYRRKDLPEKATPHFEFYVNAYPADFAFAELYANYLLETSRIDLARDFLIEKSKENPEDAVSLNLILAKMEAQATNTVESVQALQTMARYLSPNITLIKLNMKEFDPIRKTEEFQDLVKKTELAAVTLEEPVQ